MKRRLNSLTVVKVFENKFGQFVEKSFESVLCLFGFVKAAKLRDASEYSDYVQNVCAKSCLPCQILYIKQKKILQSTEKPRYEFSDTVLRSTCK